MQHKPGSDQRTDSELVDAANRGGPTGARAFEALYYRYRDWVVNTAYRFTQDRDAALDVMQDVFIYLLSKFPGFVLVAKLTTFLYPVVKHTAMAARRKSARFAGSDEVLADLPASDRAGPGDSDEIEHVLACLPAQQREVLLLRFVDGLSIEDVALALDIPVGTVKSRIHHAICTLRQDPATKKYFED